MSTEVTRRTAIGIAAGVAGCFVLGGAGKALAGTATPLRPPGAQDEDHFLATCIKCNRCESICPQNCLRTATLEDGILNWRTPVMDFHAGICDFCGKCEVVCPVGSIHDISETSSVIGGAVIEEDRCIAYQGHGCQICVDECPYGAISLNNNGHPVVGLSKCNGCGICEYKCPSNSYLTYSGGSERGINVRSLEA